MFVVPSMPLRVTTGGRKCQRDLPTRCRGGRTLAVQDRRSSLGRLAKPLAESVEPFLAGRTAASRGQAVFLLPRNPCRWRDADGGDGGFY